MVRFIGAVNPELMRVWLKKTGDIPRAAMIVAMNEPIPEGDLVDARERTCPYCAEPIKEQARKCPHCKEILDRGLKRQQQFRRMRRRRSGLAPRHVEDRIAITDLLMCIIPILGLVVGIVAITQRQTTRGTVMIVGAVGMSVLYQILLMAAGVE